MKTFARASSLVLVLSLFSTPTFAYVGPGAGLGVIGTLVGIVAAIVLAMFGLFWYPLKRAFGKKPASAATPSGEVPAGEAGGVPQPPAEANAAGTAERTAEQQGEDRPPK